MKLTIITPWLNNAKLIAEYERSVQSADEVIVIDNASEPNDAAAIARMVQRIDGGVLIRNNVNRMFAGANNQGLQIATGDIVLFLNNDISASPEGWLHIIRDNTDDDTLYAASSDVRTVAGHTLPYLEGWCLWGRREIFEAIGAWDDTYPGMYWEDNDLCFRAMQAGYKLLKLDVPIMHYSNATTAVTPGAYSSYTANMEIFTRKVENALSS